MLSVIYERQYIRKANLKKRIEYNFMISINKIEAKAIREYLPNVHIVRTMKQKSKRGHYFCEESRQAVRFLEDFRNGGCTTKKAGGKNRYSKKA